MRRSLVAAALSVLLFSGLGVGCGITPDEPEARTSDRSSASSEPETPDLGGPPSDGSTADESTSDGSTADESGTGGADGDTGALCDHLRVIADNDLALSDTDVMDLEEVETAMQESWPEVAAAYDEAIAIAPPDLAEDLRAIKRLTELFIEAMSGADGKADGSAALDALEDNQDEVMEAVEASLRAEEFTQEQCGFSLNNE